MPGIAIPCLLFVEPVRHARASVVPAGDASLFLTDRQVRAELTEGDAVGDYRPSHFGICVRDFDRWFLADPDGVGLGLMALPA
jgi:hypothetical protein